MNTFQTILCGVCLCAVVAVVAYYIGMGLGKLIWDSAERNALRNLQRGAANG